MIYYVYIVQCKGGNYYTGISMDVKRRLRQHNGELAGGAVYTRTRRPVKLVHIEPYLTRHKAASREKHIKQLSHVEKRDIIRQWSLTNAH